MFKQFTIGKKLFLVGVLILATFILFVFSYLQGSKTQAALLDKNTQVHQITNKIHLTESLLKETAKLEKVYLLQASEQLAAETRQQIRAIHQHLGELASNLDAPLLSIIDDLVYRYSEQFNLLVEAKKTIGLDEKSGLHGEMRAQVHGIETLLVKNSHSALMISMLKIRRHEKDFIQRKEQKYYELLVSEVDRFMTLLDQASVLSQHYASIASYMAAYRQKFAVMAAKIQTMQKIQLQLDSLSRQLLGTLPQLEEVNEKLFHQLSLQRYQAEETAIYFTLIVFSSGFIGVLVIFWIITRSINQPIQRAISVAERIANLDYTTDIDTSSHNEVGELLTALNTVQEKLKHFTLQTQKQSWLQESRNQFLQIIRGEQNLEELAENSLFSLCELLKSPMGALYSFDFEEEKLFLRATFAYDPWASMPAEFSLGEGLVGEVARQQKMLLVSEIPEEYPGIRSATGESTPSQLILLPFSTSSNLKGVIELALLNPVSEIQMEFLTQITESLAIAFQTNQDRLAQDKLLEDVNRVNLELLEQKEEVKRKNQKLADNANQLAQSEKELRARNQLLEGTQLELNKRADALNRSSQYKSDFLASMSHELRTPLNSMLLLSEMLSEDKEHGLSKKQNEQAQVIHACCEDLLALINEILDLSQIEAGKVHITKESIGVKSLVGKLKQLFLPMARESHLGFVTHIDPAMPQYIVSDHQRINQILKNLIGNACKFTQQGKIEVSLGLAREELLHQSRQTQIDLAIVGTVLAFSVRDTGIGIDPSTLDSLFVAFRQGDSSDTRKYGGTGLGLSISLKLARLLGGDIVVSSVPGEGSVFTLLLPLEGGEPVGLKSELQGEVQGEVKASEQDGQLVTDEADDVLYQMAESSPVWEEAVMDTSLDDKIEGYDPGTGTQNILLSSNGHGNKQPVLLIAEDNVYFANVVANLAKEHGFRPLVVTDGQSVIDLAIEQHPRALLLDIVLPGIDGWEVLRQLKLNDATAGIAVHIISALDDDGTARDLGAIQHITKPVSQKRLATLLENIAAEQQSVRRILLVEDNPEDQASVAALLGELGLGVLLCQTGKEALILAEEHQVDCAIVDLGLPDMSGLELLQAFFRRGEIPFFPVIVYTSGELSSRDEHELKAYNGRVVSKSDDVHQQLIEEVSQFLKQAASEHLGARGKRILVVDDDTRNTFVLTTLLQNQGFEVTVAENGEQALEALAKHQDIGLILMDMMMPVMDGYETSKRIRASEQWQGIPVIALTAKALPGDRQKCLNAGAVDYISKPLDQRVLADMIEKYLGADSQPPHS